MAKAKTTAMEELHNLTARQLTEVITKGVPIVNRETGEIEGYAPAPANYFSAAIKFLKDNDITADLSTHPLTEGVINQLPTFDENDEYPLQ